MQSIRLFFALALLAPTASWACGGFFCSTFPMDQVSERILFVAGEGQVTTHVQLEFNGNAPDFAWILPVPAVPTLEVSHNDQGHAVPSGVYIYRLDVGTQRHTRKLLLLR